MENKGKNHGKNHGNGGILETETAQIYYETCGSGVPVVMLHGNGESHEIFRPYVKALSGAVEAVLMDSRGHGRSKLKKGAGAEFTTRDMAEDVIALLDHLRIQKALLLGFSDGANVALEAAFLYPDRIRGVIAASGNAHPLGMLLPFYLMVAGQYAAACVMGRLCRDRRKRAEFQKSRMLNGIMFHSPKLSAKELGRITAPVLLIAGTRDVIRESHTRWMAERIPGSRLALLKGGWHEDFIRKPERYIREIRRFLSCVK
ncbi:MAG: alpha/beta hydrolase [Eubacteriales bacterium]|nr:alpha/beta hydrolase [Eubacteriales bacterium]